MKKNGIIKKSKLILIVVSCLTVASIFIGFPKAQPATADHVAITSSIAFASDTTGSKK